MRYAGTRSDPRADHNPLRSLPLYQSAATVVRPDARAEAETALWIARRDLPNMLAFFDRSRANLGEANRAKPSLRRGRQARAMRQLNQARADVRRVRAALAAAEAALLALAGAGA